MTAAELARRIAGIADEKKAEDILALDVSGLVSYTDCLVICTARNERQAKAIQDGVRDALKEEGLVPARVEGEAHAMWLLVDYLDCVLHVFTPEARAYYRLEQLWGEAPRLDVNGVRGAA